MTRTVALLALLLTFCPSALSAADETLPQITGVRVGFDGRYKVGTWTPVEVTLRHGNRSTGGEVTVTVPDGDGVPSRVSRRIAAGETSVVLYAKFGRVRSSLAVEWRAKDAAGKDVPLAQKELTTADSADADHFLPAVVATRRVIVVVGKEAMGVEGAVEIAEQAESQRPIVVRLDDCRQLPTHWFGYESVDTVVLSTSRPEIYGDGEFSAAQIAALDRWVTLGGKLVLCVAQQAEKVLADGAPLSRFAPGRLNPDMPTVSLSRSSESELERYADGTESISQKSGGDLPLQNDCFTSFLVDVQGIVDAKDLDQPLIVRTPRGFGRIVFFAADPDREPFSTWADRPLLMGRLLGLPREAIEVSRNRTLINLGYDDLSGQLRSVLDRFAGVRPVPFWIVALLVVFFLLLIGPADYFFLRKVVGRMRWTWVTFPLIVAAFCVAAYVLTRQLKDDRMHVNRVDLVDVDAVTRQVRGTSWMNVFSPQMESYDFSLQPVLPDGKAAEDAEVLFSWQGLPGGALGGMNPRGRDPVRWTTSYEFSAELDKMHGVPIPIWSSRSFTARWAATMDCPVEADLVEQGRRLTGTIRNGLDVSLSECMVVYAGQVYNLDEFEPGELIRLTTTAPHSGLGTLLTGRRLVPLGDSYEVKENEYIQSSKNTSAMYVLRAMMFYEGIDGQQYTKLSHAYQGFVDFSDLLQMNRAVLVARAPAGRAGAELLRKDRPVESPGEHLTVYRFVFPVKPEDTRPK
ncbi:MAG: hypothetical protein HQ567_06340 [Candidatus Nealsonbacteria bacterium]|nr:hypothetical protein [Candidatus Nealsonbacteria bacterium]